MTDPLACEEDGAASRCCFSYEIVSGYCHNGQVSNGPAAEPDIRQGAVSAEG